MKEQRNGDTKSGDHYTISGTLPSMSLEVLGASPGVVHMTFSVPVW